MRRTLEETLPKRPYLGKVAQPPSRKTAAGRPLPDLGQASFSGKLAGMACSVAHNRGGKPAPDSHNHLNLHVFKNFEGLSVEPRVIETIGAPAVLPLMREAGRRFVQSEHTWAVSAAAYRPAYERAWARRGVVHFRPFLGNNRARGSGRRLRAASRSAGLLCGGGGQPPRFRRAGSEPVRGPAR